MAISIGVFFAVFMYAFLGGVVASTAVCLELEDNDSRLMLIALLWPLAVALFLGIALTAVVSAAFEDKISHKEGNND